MPISSDKYPTVVYIAGRDPGSESDYEELIHRLGFELQVFTCSDELIATARWDRPACLILDLDCEQGRAGEVQRWLFDQGIEAPVILTTSETCSEDAIAGLRLGAIAVLGKPVSLRLLEEYLSFAASRLRTHVDWEQRYMQFNQVFSALTDRQRQVLDYAVRGLLNKTIASKLHVSKRTVEADRSKVLKAFAAESFYEVSMRMGEHRVLNELQRLRRRETLLRMEIDTTMADHEVGHGV